MYHLKITVAYLLCVEVLVEHFSSEENFKKRFLNAMGFIKWLTELPLWGKLLLGVLLVGVVATAIAVPIAVTADNQTTSTQAPTSPTTILSTQPFTENSSEPFTEHTSESSTEKEPIPFVNVKEEIQERIPFPKEASDLIWKALRTRKIPNKFKKASRFQQLTANVDERSLQ